MKHRQQTNIQPKASRPYVTIEYPYNDETHNIFMRNNYETYFRMEKDGRIIHPKFFKFSRPFRDMFTKNGYNFVPEKRAYPRGRRKVFDIDVTVRKIDEKDRSIIRIKIEGATVDEVINKERQIEIAVRKVTREEPEIKLWERLEMC
jgi:hypothetical protein